MKNLIKLCLTSAIIIASFYQVAAQANSYPLTITQPQQNLDINNRFYRAYPGLEYNVRAGVTGGNYPYRYSLTISPAGMNINSNTGEISWPSPTQTATPQPVTLLVTDSKGGTTYASWNITVTTNGFYFIDSSAPDGGTGSISSPWNSWEDFYLGRLDSTYKNAFLYFREGTYTYPQQLTYGSGANSNRIQLIAHPHIFLGYPEESVTFDGQGNSNKIHLHLFGDDFYFDRINFVNNISYGLEVNGGDRLTVRRSSFSNFIIGDKTDNNAAIGIKNDSVNSEGVIEYTPTAEDSPYDSEKMYYLVQDNTFTNIDTIGIENYGVTQALYEDNEFNNCGYSCINLKSTVNRITLRGNEISTVSGYSISAVSQFFVARAEILFNHIKSGTIQIGAFTGDSGPDSVDIYRNTIEGLFWLKGIESNDGMITINNNIIINNDPNNRIRDNSSEHYSIKDNSRISSVDNLGGGSTDGIINSSGILTEQYKSYTGTHGHIIGAIPLPPANISIISNN